MTPPASAAYFPSLYSSPDAFLHDDSVAPERPSRVFPIYDPAACSQPLEPHDDGFQDSNFPAPELDGDLVLPSEAPPTPMTPNNPYLFPVMNRNERIRLTMLWYMTQGALQNPELVSTLQEKVNLVRDFIGWEYCIMGIVDNACFTRVATAGLPLAIVPRRESTCSHTINQPSGSIFWVSDLSKDWRFKDSPPVSNMGLKSYAGTSLLCHTIDGTEVPLGSLCVASDEPNMKLSLPQQKALKRVAHMLVKEVITFRRLERHRQRQKMSNAIQKLEELPESPDFESDLLKVVRDFYPDATVSLRDVQDRCITLTDCSKLTVTDAQHGLWENVELLDKLLESQNHTDLETDRTVRAVLSQAGTFAQGLHLVVETNQVAMVFDDVDAWFIERCARLIWDASQRNLLAEANQAKETFLRGITHQLRTPIHGILGAAELLAEEMNIQLSGSQSALNGIGSHDMTPQTSLEGTSSVQMSTKLNANGTANDIGLTADDRLEPVGMLAGSQASVKIPQFLETINSAGKELMTTVNNILKLNRWAEIATSLNREPVACDIRQLEADLVKELSESLSPDNVADVTLIFENRLASDAKVRIPDASLLRDCIAALITNAIQWTARGTVIVKMGERDQLFRIDVTDDGAGIPESYHDLIFRPYEKVDPHTRGAGLGLTLASKIAEALGGRLFLERSQPGEGTTFSLELPNTGITCNLPPTKPLADDLAAATRCNIITDCAQETHPLTAYFAALIASKDICQGRHNDIEAVAPVELDIVNFTSGRQMLEARLLSVDTKRPTICVVPSEGFAKALNHDSYRKKVRLFHGPFTTSKLEYMSAKLAELSSRCHQTTTAAPVGPDTSRVIPKLETASNPRATATPVALIVDDNPTNLTILRMFCRKRGIAHHEATDGEQAVQKFSTEREPPINLVLMDLQMPICDGLRATTRIRELEAVEGRPSAAIFMVTGQDSPKDKADSLLAGADEFMVKPVKMKALSEAINAYLRPSAGSSPN